MSTQIEQASFPNWIGRGGTTTYTLHGNRLAYIVAKPAAVRQKAREAKWSGGGWTEK